MTTEHFDEVIVQQPPIQRGRFAGRAYRLIRRIRAGQRSWYWIQLYMDFSGLGEDHWRWVDVKGPYTQRPAALRKLEEYQSWS